MESLEPNVLCHHIASPPPVVLTHFEMERGLRHAIRILVKLLEDNLVALPRLDIAKPAVVNDESSVYIFGDPAVGEGIAMNLGGLVVR